VVEVEKRGRQAMSGAELLALRGVLVQRRQALLDRLVVDTADLIEPGFLRLLADIQTTIAAIDAEVIELEGDTP
jgi:hypothetical protein